MMRRAGLRADERAMVERRDRNLAADERFDVGQRDRVRLTAEADRVAGGACARRAADAMHIVFRDVRELVVDDVRQLLDVEAARRDFGRHQRRDAVFLEILQRL